MYRSPLGQAHCWLVCSPAPRLRTILIKPSARTGSMRGPRRQHPSDPHCKAPREGTDRETLYTKVTIQIQNNKEIRVTAGYERVKNSGCKAKPQLHVTTMDSRSAAPARAGRSRGKALQPKPATTDLNVKTFWVPVCMQRMFCIKREAQARRGKNFLCFTKGNAIVPQKYGADPELCSPPVSRALGPGQRC